jgi:3-hydroxybutyrate dehydrogenase
VAIINGGSSGIGLAIAEDFLRRGIRAVSWDLQAPANRNIAFAKCDVGSEASVQQALSETAKLGAPAVLVNNAGLQFLSPVEEFPLEKWNQLLGVILTGTFLCSKAVIPAMKAEKSGRIVNISSIHGKLASPYKAAYVAAKHGVIGLTKVMAQELGAFGITANSICPGFVDTPLLRKQLKSQAELNKMSEDLVLTEIMLKPQVVKRLTTAAQITALVEFLCSDAASTITGEAYNMGGGWGMGA